MVPWTLARLERAVETFSTQLQCAICLCAYDIPVSLPCHHCFCEECIHRALELKPLCPICKTPAKKRQLRYDTTVQELLRAMKMLSAAPFSVKEEDQNQEKRVATKTALRKVAAAPERRSSPRRGNGKLPTRSLDMWMSGELSQSCNEVKMKKEKTVTTERRASSRRTLVHDSNSPMSPALFDMTGTLRSNGRITETKEVVTLRRRSRVDRVNGKSMSSCAAENRSQGKKATWGTMDEIVAETQLEEREQTQQMATRQRSSTNVEMTTVDDTQLEAGETTRLQTATNGNSRAAKKADDSVLETPTRRKRRRSTMNGVTLDDKLLKDVAVRPGSLAHATQAVETVSMAGASQAQSVSNQVFQVGDVVEIIERQWVGINKQGGAARITQVHGDGYYAVKFVIGGKDNRVPGTFIRRPAEELLSDLAPSCSVKKRQRRRVSDVMVSPDLLSIKSSRESTDSSAKVTTKTTRKQSGMVFLCSGFKERRKHQIDEWAELLGAEVVQHWSNDVTHLIVKCISGDGARNEDPSMDDSDSTSSPQTRQDGKRALFGDPTSGRWVKIRSLKYLKALVGGRWIVSDEWLQACAKHGGYVKEVNYEADGHWKGRRIPDAVKRSRLTREKLLQLSSPDVDRSAIGTMLFADFCFHIIGDFLPPMPPITELNTLICMGGGKLIASMDDIPNEMHMRENRARRLIIVSDKINPIALRQQTRQLKAQPQMKAVSSAIIVSYLWVINSISEVNLRELP